MPIYICEKCGDMRWRTLIKKQRFQCQNCGVIVDLKGKVAYELTKENKKKMKEKIISHIKINKEIEKEIRKPQKSKIQRLLNKIKNAFK